MFVALLLAQALAALDSTIVSTAMPTIVADLGGFHEFSWVFSLYLLAYTATIPIYGRLADLYGRRVVLFGAIGLFLFGSALSGLSTSMTALIFFRGIQGLGAGGVQPIANTLIGDLFTLEERARRQAYISTVWAVSAVTGPLFGGLLVLLSWRLIFFVNLPIGVFALYLVARHYRVVEEPHRAPLDLLGSALLLYWVGLLILGLLQGSTWGFLSRRSLAVFALAISGGVLFVRRQATSPAPLFPLRLLRIRVIGIGDAVTFLAGGLTIGLSGFLPTYVEGVDRLSPTVAGLVLTTMSVGWPFASANMGRLLPRLGARGVGILGGVLALLGAGLLLFVTPKTPVAWLAAMSFCTGMGLGLVNTTSLIFIQETVPWQERGVATASNMFSRQFGSAVFVAVMGAVLNAGMAKRLPNGEAVLNRLLDPSLAPLGAAMARAARQALAASLHSVYLTGFGLALATALLELLFPNLLAEHSVRSAEAD